MPFLFSKYYHDPMLSCCLRNKLIFSSHQLILNPKTSRLVKMTAEEVVETSVTVKNMPIKDNNHPDDHIPPTY